MNDLTRTPVNECLTCHYKMDATGPAIRSGRTKPQKDDLSICLKCGTVAEFDENLNLRPLTKEQLDKIKKENPDLLLELILVQKVIKARSQQN